MKEHFFTPDQIQKVKVRYVERLVCLLEGVDGYKGMDVYDYRIDIYDSTLSATSIILDVTGKRLHFGSSTPNHIKKIIKQIFLE
jgi:hypothetical protein